jgi:CRP/FNR family transcriptional regulator, nitrogen fixation regulation protein
MEMKTMMYRAASVGIIDLPMSRNDIADYLGLTVETVSKTLSELDECGVLDVSGRRQFTLLNRRRLAAMDMRRQAVRAREPGEARASSR